eukprot:COSAG01_NODE_5493_length_4227_cov_2.861192_3_plen_89_part_00
MHEESPFRYREICWRGVGRYDVRCPPAEWPWSSSELRTLPCLAPLLRRCLGQDYKLLFMGVVVARPGGEICLHSFSIPVRAWLLLHHY